MEDEETKPKILPHNSRVSRDATGDAVLNFFNTEVGRAALNNVSGDATKTAQYAIYALQAILASWATKRVLLDVLDMIMKINETRNALIKKP